VRLAALDLREISGVGSGGSVLDPGISEILCSPNSRCSHFYV